MYFWYIDYGCLECLFILSPTPTARPSFYMASVRLWLAFLATYCRKLNNWLRCFLLYDGWSDSVVSSFFLPACRLDPEFHRAHSEDRGGILVYNGWLAAWFVRWSGCVLWMLTNRLFGRFSLFFPPPRGFPTIFFRWNSNGSRLFWKILEKNLKKGVDTYKLVCYYSAKLKEGRRTR